MYEQMTELIAKIVDIDELGYTDAGEPVVEEEPEIVLLQSQSAAQIAKEKATDQQPVLSIFAKQVELAIRQTRALCFKHLMEVKPDYLVKAKEQ